MPSGVVKFFHTAKGYGFISPDDGREDIFVHIRDVEKAGLTGLREGQRLEFDVELDSKSGRFIATYLDMVTTDPHTTPEAIPTGPASHPSASLSTGIVRWFDVTRGFGFIRPNQGGEDVFVHISTVEQGGLPTLVEGQALAFRADRNGRSGKLAASHVQPLGDV